jgi:hypothetical protein
MLRTPRLKLQPNLAPNHTGDVPVWRNKDGTVTPVVSGFVQVGEGPALNVTAYGSASELSAERFGAVPYVLRPTVFNRMLNDPLVTSVGAVMSVVLAFFGLYEIGVKLRTPAGGIGK